MTSLDQAVANQPSHDTPDAPRIQKSAKRNVVANVTGQAWYAALGFISVPIYLRLMGLEAYGLVGFFVSMSALINVFDFGLTSAITRALAQRGSNVQSLLESRDLVRTFEVTYWGIGLAIGFGVAALAPVIATRWLHGSALTPSVLTTAILMMGAAMVVQWPVSLYQGGLFGLEDQVRLNVLLAVVNTTRSVGAIVVLLFTPTIVAFFTWQVVIGAIQIAAMRWMLWGRLRHDGHRPAVNVGILRLHGRFAASMGLTSILALLFRQADRIILSSVLDLKTFAYYSLAFTAGNALSMLANPIFSALFPRFVSLVARGDVPALTIFYHRACQMVSVLILPCAAVGIMFSGELIRLWTGSDELAQAVGPICSVIILGTAFNALGGIPYDVQVARGWTKLGIIQNAIGVVVLVPAIYFLSTRVGAIGAAWVWVFYNAASVMIMIPLTHRHTIPGELRPWALKDVGGPLIAATVIAGLARLLIPTQTSRLGSLAAIATTGIATLIVCIGVAPYAREALRSRWRQLRMAQAT